jgi:uncharacterized protein YoxC
MNKWIAIPVIAVLVIGIIVMAVIMTQQIGKLNDELDSAETQIAALSSEVSSLENNISTLQENNSTLQTKLADSENEVSGLQADLDAANAYSAALKDTIASMRSTISAQDDELKKIKYPRHFASLAELTNWLQKDDTNVKYPGVSTLERGYILQVRALQDGYLLPVRIPLAAIGLTDLDTNFAVIGDIIYTVRASDDSVQRWSSTLALPSYPIPSP